MAAVDTRELAGDADVRAHDPVEVEPLGRRLGSRLKPWLLRLRRNGWTEDPLGLTEQRPSYLLREDRPCVRLGLGASLGNEGGHRLDGKGFDRHLQICGRGRIAHRRSRRSSSSIASASSSLLIVERPEISSR